MCGIAGILSVRTSNELSNHIQAMQGALSHRGPDDSGIYLSNISGDRQSALAHTRLSILDLSAAGHQPMSTTDGRYTITFNGEIYNFQDLRKELISQGEIFKSQTDTEIILKLYQKLGRECVTKLRGMFAFAIWDELEKTCFIARDPLGIKPLYYWHSNQTLVFASELRAVIASGLPPINLNLAGLYGYLTTGSVPEPHTLIADIQCLEAGNWLYWQEGNLTKYQYWQLDFTPEQISLADAQVKVRQALKESIKYHFISDVPVGIFLSGGIDSTAILALATEITSSQLSTYSIAFAKPEWNEGVLAQKAANHFGAKHTEFQVDCTFAKSVLPDFLASIDQPTIDGFNTFCVSKVAHDNGMKVVLSGLGGDEIFGGYKSFQSIPQMMKWGRRLNKLPYVSQALASGLQHWGNTSKLNRISDFLNNPPTFASAYKNFRGIFSHSEAIAIIQSLTKSNYLPSPKLSNFNDDRITPTDQVSLLELSSYMRNQLLRDSDVMSMRWGLELRVPFVDRTLIESVASIPSHMRLAQSKQLLTASIPEIPEWIVNQPKRGFSFPFASWMQTDFGDYFMNLDIPKEIPLDSWYRRWSLAILKHWLAQVGL
ncbi:asparagine synthase (glutamine-hydrolyzing) [Pseudanabaena mucicola]|uniref:asparagine synthase (glutamine-hydrolyzing) n=1 Tax=Pseudanabaena mucicola FACHB-723 TaxID=2692860 RepID=A0ABR7ZTG8_9CYAN|nr:asparagine synthase (glutamine-hydrolyzing) [Pseudanabaena mucicola]MBD2187079.1 asparagine synthase (glutamine-hydrolyzing) [Pseudanabaena mucicola FACHB-723]